MGRALVTGATSGIGRAAAVALARDGFDVIVHGRDAARGADAVAEIEAQGGRAQFIGADLLETEGAGRLAAAAGEIDVLVNNAGTSWFGPSQELDAEGFDRLFDGNVRATYQLTAAVAPGMAQRGHGSIINLGSMAGKVGLDGGAAYGATKAALASLTRSWAAEYGAAGVRVNTVSPGPVYSTPGKRELIDALSPTTLLGRGAEVGEIAEVIAFLASERASYITGAELAADAGRTAV
jgi:NAD(P)-dependent dehydrogenase (short-subunit alcohol dehydrogenase family)